MLKIESVKGGRLLGVSTVSQADACGSFIVEIDGKPAATGHANRFRAAPLNSLEVDNPAQGGHYGGFSIPLHLHWYDGGTHEVVIKGTSGTLLAKRRCAFPVNSNAQYLQKSILMSDVYTPHVGSKKVAIVAAYSTDDQVNECQKWLLKYLREQGYYVVLALALPDECVQHRPISLAGLCHAFLVRRNVGYDFGSWAHAWLRWGGLFKTASQVLFVNDSIVGPVVPGNFLAEFDALDYDLCGVTESFQHTWHVQSYFWRVAPSVLAGAHLDEFFLCRHAVAASKDEAIKNYEVAMAKYFHANGFKVGVWAASSSIRSLAFDAFQQTLQHRLAIKSLVYQNSALATAMTSHVAEKAMPYLAALLSDQHQNPAQHFWKGLIELGFPFIKKELLTKNPVQYPFVDELSGFFDSDVLRPILSDLLRRSSPSVAHFI
ncbi:MAG: hypothetical protein EAZ37_09145 [Burkholderiales bacterium]|nr:MAG: hypothetical protein EAZ37_09145 [Burkholderiales bacterium]